MAKSRALAVRLPIDTWNHLNDEARRMGITLSALARTRLMLTSEFEGPIQECIEDLSRRLGVSRHEFLEAVVIDFMARFTSGSLAGGSGRHLPQFVYTDRGLLRGKDLFEHMLAYYAGADRDRPAVIPGAPTREGDERPSEPPRAGTEGRVEAGPREPVSSEDDASTLTRIERARIDKAMFERIMGHYRDKEAAGEPENGQSGS